MNGNQTQHNFSQRSLKQRFGISITIAFTNSGASIEDSASHFRVFMFMWTPISGLTNLKLVEIWRVYKEVAEVEMHLCMYASYSWFFFYLSCK